MTACVHFVRFALRDVIFVKRLSSSKRTSLPILLRDVCTCEIAMSFSAYSA